MKEKVFFENLDGLRFVAFFMVFTQHAISPLFSFSPSVNATIGAFSRNFFHGGTGVSIFFVLSGFLITYLILKEIQVKGRLNIGYFYVRRFLRIWPLFYSVVIIGVIIIPITKSFIGITNQVPINQLYYYLFLSNFDVISIINQKEQLLPYISITWSVSVEEQFYLVWPLAFFLMPKHLYKYVFIITILISLIFRYFNVDGIVNYFHSFSVCGDLAVGGFGAYYSINSKNFINWLRKLSFKIIFSIYVLGAFWFIYSSAYYSAVFTRLISSFFFVFVVLEQNFCNNSFYKFSNSKFLSFWGKYTYGLYLLHPLVLYVGETVIIRVFKEKESSPVSIFLLSIIGLISTMFLSYYSSKYFESPFLRIKNRFSFISTF